MKHHWVIVNSLQKSNHQHIFFFFERHSFLPQVLPEGTCALPRDLGAFTFGAPLSPTLGAVIGALGASSAMPKGFIPRFGTSKRMSPEEPTWWARSTTNPKTMPIKSVIHMLAMLTPTETALGHGWDTKKAAKKNWITLPEKWKAFIPTLYGITISRSCSLALHTAHSDAPTK